MNEGPKGGSRSLRTSFSSMKMGLILLGLIAFSAGVGTLLPQGNIYSSWWFRLLVGLLCLNLLVCSAHRFKGVYLMAFKPRPPADLQRVPQKVRQEIKGRAEDLRSATQQALQRRGYILTALDQENGWSFVAVKRRWGNWGSFITHIAFVLLVTGVLLGSALGFKGYLTAGAGSTVSIRDIELWQGQIAHDFSVRINSAEDRFLPTGERDNWYTDLSILESGQEVARKTLSVNHPFTYRGVTFYQSNYAEGARFTVEYEGQRIPVVLRNRGENYFQAPGSNLYLIVAGINNDPQNPLVYYQVYKGAGARPVQQGELGVRQSANLQGMYSTFDGYAGFTGLQVKEDPGIWLVWLGSALLLLGLFLSFYWRPVTVAGFLLTDPRKQGILTLGLPARKYMEGASKELAALVKEIQANREQRSR